jgi:predicted GIY-YIG superfamily endonuclease
MNICEGQLLLLPPARPLVERLGAEFFRAIPECPGVYFMCATREGVLYVGKAKNLRRRLASYRSANPERMTRKLRRLMAAVERIHWDECESEAAALAREAELLRTLRPKFNTAGVYIPPPQWFGWEAADGRLKMGITEDRESFTRTFGPTRRRVPMIAALLRLLWWANHPAAPAYEIPAGLRDLGRAKQWEQPATWMSPEELAGLLHRFFSGEDASLPDLLLMAGARDCRFTTAWQTEDASVLRDFFDDRFSP